MTTLGRAARAAACAAAAALTALAPTGTAHAAEQATTLPLREAVAALPVAEEDRTGYDRDLFGEATKCGRWGDEMSGVISGRFVGCRAASNASAGVL